MAQMEQVVSTALQDQLVPLEQMGLTEHLDHKDRQDRSVQQDQLDQSVQQD